MDGTRSNDATNSAPPELRAEPDAGLEWRIDLPEFFGPFDLLLKMLQKRQLDLSTTSLAAIAHQFAEIVTQAGDLVPLVETSEFAAVTAKLLTIKSAALLPRATDNDAHLDGEDQSEIDDPTDLTERLARYWELKGRASVLRQRTQAGIRCYRRSSPRLAVEMRPRVRIAAGDLMRALRQMADRDRHRLRERRVGRDTLTLARALRIIEDRMRRQPRVRFSQLVAAASTTRQLVTFFLATLEICKAGKATLAQEAVFDEIFLSRIE